MGLAKGKGESEGETVGGKELFKKKRNKWAEHRCLIVPLFLFFFCLESRFGRYMFCIHNQAVKLRERKREGFMCVCVVLSFMSLFLKWDGME